MVENIEKLMASKFSVIKLFAFREKIIAINKG